MPLDIKRLRTFVAVAEELGFARAGIRLGLAQPAVSKHVKDLEEMLGGQLIERRADGIRVTEAGALLLEQARELIRAVTTAEERVQRLARGAAGTLVIGYNETVSWNSVIPRTVRRFRNDNPDVDLTLLPMLSVDQIEALEDRRIDAGFMFRWGHDAEGLETRQLLSTPIMLAVEKNSALDRNPPKRLSDLEGEPFIFFPRNLAPAYHDAIFERCAKAGFRLNVVQEVYNESAALSLVAVGMGVTVGPEAARSRCPASVKFVPFPGLKLSASLDLVWRGESSEHPLVARLIAATDAVTREQ
jgi:DNA-binding transcriptional LysR family regulator